MAQEGLTLFSSATFPVPDRSEEKMWGHTRSPTDQRGEKCVPPYGAPRRKEASHREGKEGDLSEGCSSPKNQVLIFERKKEGG